MDKLAEERLDEFDLKLNVSSAQLIELALQPERLIGDYLRSQGYEVNAVLFMGASHLGGFGTTRVQGGEVPLIFKLWHTSAGKHKSCWNVLIGNSEEVDTSPGLRRVGEVTVEQYRDVVRLATPSEVVSLATDATGFFKARLKHGGYEVNDVHFISQRIDSQGAHSQTATDALLFSIHVYHFHSGRYKSVWWIWWDPSE